MNHKAYLSLGSNIGNARDNLRAAIAALQSCGEVVAQSPAYATAPVDYKQQPWFINCALILQTQETPQELMAAILGIEHQMGRRRSDPSAAKGPRTIDIDIVLYDDLLVESENLNIPHPRMHQRRFVLEPLADIAPQARHPALHCSVRELLQNLGPGGPATMRLEPL